MLQASDYLFLYYQNGLYYLKILNNYCIALIFELRLPYGPMIDFANLISRRVHNKRREGEYPTLTILHTSTLRKVRAVSHQVFLFCINTFSVAKDLMIGVNSFVVFCIWIINIISFVWESRTRKKCSNEFNSWTLTTI